MTELFAYGTLRDPEYQLALFDRRLPARPATLPGWMAVLAESGYLTLVRAPGEGVGGDLIRLDDAELALADAWEDVEYERLRVEARDERSGTAVPAFVYVRPTGSRERAPARLLANNPREQVLAAIRALRARQ